MESIILVALVLTLVVTFFGGIAWYVLRNLLYICGPNEVLVFEGASSRVSDKRVGYRIVKGGRSVRKPILEQVERMDLTNMTVEVSVSNAYSRGGIPLTVQGVANLKVAGHQPVLNNALERLLGRSRKEIAQIAKDTLEGNLRGVLSQLTPEEVNEDKITFAEKLLEEAENDLQKLGLELDVLKIQNVTDDVKYLDSIGRRQSAELIARARTAEANAEAESAIREAENHKRAELTRAESEIGIMRAEVNKRIVDAQSRRTALVAEELAKVEALVAKAESELKVQQARIEQVRRRLSADVIAPAHAEMEALQANAKANAAKIVEDGRATAGVLEEMIATWQHGGEDARDIFLMQKLQAVMGSLVETIGQVHVDKVTVLPTAGGSRAAQAVTLVEELKAGLGVDLPRILEGFAHRDGERTDPGSPASLTTSYPLPSEG